MVKRILDDLPTSSKLMVFSVLILFISQFLPYFNDAAMVSGLETIYIVPGSHGTGWDLHPYAIHAIVILGFTFSKADVFCSKYFFPYGWIVCLAIFLSAMSPGAPFRASGAALGGLSFCLALSAFFLRYKEGSASLKR